jgi:hypothetical protein
MPNPHSPASTLIQPEETPMTLIQAQQIRIESLVEIILTHYTVGEPPVPIEKILTNPPGGLQGVDISDMSLVFGIGENRYEYRLALGRLLYRELCRTGYSGPDAPTDQEPLPYNSEAARYFAMAVLMPRPWLQKAAKRRSNTLQILSDIYQVPGYAMASRLSQCGWRVKGMD